MTRWNRLASTRRILGRTARITTSRQEGYYSEDDWGPYQASQPDPNNEAEARFRAANTFRPTIPLADQIVDDDYYYSLPIPWNVTPFGTPNDKDDLKQIEKADVLKEMYFTGTVPSYVEWRSMFISYVHTRKIPNHKKCRIMLRTIDKSVNEYKALRNILNSRMGDTYRDAIVCSNEYTAEYATSKIIITIWSSRCHL
jgi:hypothetical protein